ncbi:MULTISPECIES: DUF1684 domain-containing protein [unclassified Haladaptatus]|uniref:DUF1684 domain-containing protein n=1 Tax=unclassified Haladaptatus TaxID=2622732 RepID=UPI0023E875F4|nr:MULTISPECIES: DUF1684 domain-containing protein [unclassified Haladaptatus]
MTDATFDAATWAEELEAHREEKDQFFSDHRQSPVAPENRDEFDGLQYFAPDPDYRVEATATVHEDPETVSLETTAGPEVEYERSLTLTFNLGEGEYTLAAYRQGDGPYFVPFRDKTTGQQTFQYGRYMEFETEDGLEDGDELTLDFNLAFNPFCAYSDAFTCPLPPRENWLDVVITAGEKWI